MPLTFRQGDALDAALKNALDAALNAASKIAEPTDRATLTAQVAALRYRRGDASGAKAAAEQALAMAQKIDDSTWRNLGEQVTFAVALARAGERPGTDVIFERIKQRAAKEEILGPGMLAEVATALHDLGDDKAARALTRTLIQIAADPGPQQDETRFHLGIYNLALFGDPDGAEALLPKVKDPSERWATFREIARLRGKTDTAKGVAAMKRCMSIWLPSKDKSASNLPGLVNVMRQLGQSAEARTLVEKLPALFPKKEDRDQVFKAQALSYGYLRLFPQALAAVGKLSKKPDQSGTYLELGDAALAADDLVAYDKTIALVLKNLPESDKIGLTLFLHGLRASAQARLGKRAEAAAILEKTVAGIGKLPDVRGAAGLLTTLCDAILTPPTK